MHTRARACVRGVAASCERLRERGGKRALLLLMSSVCVCARARARVSVLVCWAYSPSLSL